MLSYSLEKLNNQLKDEMLLLADLYWQDVAAPFHAFPPDVDWQVYMTLEQAGRLRVVVGRNDGGLLKAAAVVVVAPHPHYACICGSLPLLFLHPDYRKGTEGMRLVRLAERAAEKTGAQLMMTHGGMHNGVYRLFEGMHYQDFGRYYVKVLKNGPNGTDPVFKLGTPHPALSPGHPSDRKGGKGRWRGSQLEAAHAGPLSLEGRGKGEGEARHLFDSCPGVSESGEKEG